MPGRQIDEPISLLEHAYHQRRLFAGAVCLIVNGEIVAKNLVGGNDGSRFEIGSITKLLTAIAAIGADIDSSLRLDARIEDIVPGLRFDDRLGAEVTVRHLLTHTSGLPAAGRDWGPSDPDALHRVAVEDVAHHRFHAAPGDITCYSSTALSLAGLALQVARGVPFKDLLADEVLRRGGMRMAGFPNDVDPADVSWPHVSVAGGWQAVSRQADNPAGYPSGFLLASLEDLANLALTLLEGGLGAGVLDALVSTTASRWVDHAPSPWSGVSANYGLGSLTGYWNGGTVIRHGGIGLTSNCSLDLFPESRSAVVLLTNGCHEPTFVELFKSCYRVVGGEENEPSDQSDPSHVPDRRPKSGTFVNMDDGRLATLRSDVKHVSIDLGDGRSTLRPAGEGRWLSTGSNGVIPIGIPTDTEGDHVYIWGEPFHRFGPPRERHPVISDVQGVYRDSFWDDPATRFGISNSDESLVVSSEGHDSVGRWIADQHLATDHGVLEFKTGATGFRLGNATRYTRM